LPGQAADLPDSDGVEEILGEVAGLFLVDPNDCKPDLSQNFQTFGLYLLAPYRSAKYQKPALFS
jgi:hypothetical protein